MSPVLYRVKPARGRETCGLMLDWPAPVANRGRAPLQAFWAPGFPSGLGDCVAMLLPSGQWAEADCGTALPFVCEEKLYGGSTLVAQVGDDVEEGRRS